MTNTIDASCEDPPARADAHPALHSILSPIPLYPRFLLRPTDHQEPLQDHSPLPPPSDNALLFMQLSNFQKCVALSASPAADLISEPNEGTSEVRRGGGRPCKKEQNLKNISNHIRSLIAQNPQLTIPHLCFLLYEMIGKTPLGTHIISSGYVLPSQQLLEQLRAKYQEQEPQDERTRTIVKNVRRRLYDSLNVMISAKVLRKVSKNRLEVIDWRKDGRTSREEDGVVVRLREQLQLRKTEISSKLEVKQFLMQKTELVRKLAERNAPHFFNIDKASLLYLPIVLAQFPEQTTINLSHSELNIESPSKAFFYSDIDYLQILFQQEPNELMVKEEHKCD